MVLCNFQVQVSLAVPLSLKIEQVMFLRNSTNRLAKQSNFRRGYDLYHCKDKWSP